MEKKCLGINEAFLYNEYEVTTTAALAVDQGAVKPCIWGWPLYKASLFSSQMKPMAWVFHCSLKNKAIVAACTEIMTINDADGDDDDGDDDKNINRRRPTIRTTMNITIAICLMGLSIATNIIIFTRIQNSCAAYSRVIEKGRSQACSFWLQILYEIARLCNCKN